MWLRGRVFDCHPGDPGSIPVRVRSEDIFLHLSHLQCGECIEIKFGSAWVYIHIIDITSICIIKMQKTVIFTPVKPRKNVLLFLFCSKHRLWGFSNESPKSKLSAKVRKIIYTPASLLYYSTVTVSVTFLSLAFVFKQKKRIMFLAYSMQNPRKIHATCARSEPFRASSRSFHVQPKIPALKKKIYIGYSMKIILYTVGFNPFHAIV